MKLLWQKRLSTQLLETFDDICPHSWSCVIPLASGVGADIGATTKLRSLLIQTITGYFFFIMNAFAVSKNRRNQGDQILSLAFKQSKCTYYYAHFCSFMYLWNIFPITEIISLLKQQQPILFIHQPKMTDHTALIERKYTGNTLKMYTLFTVEMKEHVILQWKFPANTFSAYPWAFTGKTAV